MFILSAVLSTIGSNTALQAQAMQAAQQEGGDFQMYLKEVWNPIATILSHLFCLYQAISVLNSFYASIGAAVDNETDSQQFLLPIIMPLILEFIFSPS
jgi:ABC-2 type transport system permease protein